MTRAKTASIEAAYPPTPTRPYRVELHLLGCACPHCRPVAPALPIARLTFAGIAVGNLIAFAIDPAGSWQALSGALRHAAGLL